MKPIDETSRHGEPALTVARFGQLKPWSRAFLDSVLPDHAKENYRVIGPGVFDAPGASPPIAAAHGFSMGFVKCQPGKGAALHTHRTREVFMPLNGPLRVYYGPSGEDRIDLAPWDVLSVAPEVMRGFTNIGFSELILLALVQDGPAGPEQVRWHENVIAAAGELGVFLRADGKLVS